MTEVQSVPAPSVVESNSASNESEVIQLPGNSRQYALIPHIPQFKPSPFRNLELPACACATTRLLQIRFETIQKLSIYPKLKAELALSANETPEEREFSLWNWINAVNNQVMTKKERKHGNGFWTPILHAWEDYPGAATHSSDIGLLVYSDATGSRFLIIERDQCICENHLAEVELRAQRLFCIAKYIGYNPSQIAYTLTLPNSSKAKLPSGFLESAKTGVLKQTGDGMFGLVTRENYQKVLPLQTVLSIDYLISTCHIMQKQVQSCRSSLNTDRPTLMTEVIGTWSKPRINDDYTTPSFCKWCKSIGVELRKCVKCHSAYYCSKHCQVLDWKLHKLGCKNGSESPVSSGPASSVEISENGELVLN
ncbi:hypothetical protein HK098_001892 [Nowakowskiella sp. JEL0407]|nr:hypothetical protein HK098_001892 [Nowakowskiella sp. JEL0407]